MKMQMRLLFAGLAYCLFAGLTACEKEKYAPDSEGASLPEGPIQELNWEAPDIDDDLDLFALLPDSIRKAMESEVVQGEGALPILDPVNAGVSLRSALLAYYRLRMVGSTYNGEYPFDRPGCMIISPTVRPAGGVNLNNGVNPIDLGVFSGNPTLTERGALWFMTNTAMCQYGRTGCNSIPVNAQLDLVYMMWNAQNRTLLIQLDGRFFGNAAAGNSMLGFLNNFSTRGHLTDPSYRIIDGYLVFQFSSDWRHIAGEINFRGSSLFGFGVAPYQARFWGVATSYCNQ